MIGIVIIAIVCFAVSCNIADRQRTVERVTARSGSALAPTRRRGAAFGFLDWASTLAAFIIIVCGVAITIKGLSMVSADVAGYTITAGLLAWLAYWVGSKLLRQKVV